MSLRSFIYASLGATDWTQHMGKFFLNNGPFVSPGNNGNYKCLIPTSMIYVPLSVHLVLLVLEADSVLQSFLVACGSRAFDEVY